MRFRAYLTEKDQQLFKHYGWDHALSLFRDERLPQYKLPIIPGNELIVGFYLDEGKFAIFEVPQRIRK